MSKAAEKSRDFKSVVSRIAGKLLTEWVGEARAAEARGRIVSAFSAAALSARDPSDFYDCTPESVAQCVALAALVGIMPGTGATALAYLIPRRPRRGEKPQLQYQFSHRGLAALAWRVGLVLIAFPVSYDDTLVLRDGEIAELLSDPDAPPMEWEDLRGVMLIVRERAGGTVLYRGWVAKALIEKRREMSESFKWADRGGDWEKSKSTWHTWPVEMAQKTAMHYAIARGWAVIDDTQSMRALSVDAAADVIDTTADLVSSEPAPSVEDALGIEDKGGDAMTPDFEKENEALKSREKVPAEGQAVGGVEQRQDAPETDKRSRLDIAKACKALEKSKGFSLDRLKEIRRLTPVKQADPNGSWSGASLLAYEKALQEAEATGTESEIDEVAERADLLKRIYEIESDFVDMAVDEKRKEAGFGGLMEDISGMQLPSLRAYLEALEA